MKRILLTAAVLAVPYLPSEHALARDWQAYDARLRDAQVACQEINSAACTPYIAEALGVAAALTEAAKVNMSAGGTTYTVVFHSGRQETCTERWREIMNGLQLTQLAIASEGDIDAAQETYWLAALMRASREHCHLQR
jgi:hypothetical protein